MEEGLNKTGPDIDPMTGNFIDKEKPNPNTDQKPKIEISKDDLPPDNRIDVTLDEGQESTDPDITLGDQTVKYGDGTEITYHKGSPEQDITLGQRTERDDDGFEITLHPPKS